MDHTINLLEARETNGTSKIFVSRGVKRRVRFGDNGLSRQTVAINRRGNLGAVKIINEQLGCITRALGGPSPPRLTPWSSSQRTRWPAHVTSSCSRDGG